MPNEVLPNDVSPNGVSPNEVSPNKIFLSTKRKKFSQKKKKFGQKHKTKQVLWKSAKTSAKRKDQICFQLKFLYKN